MIKELPLILAYGVNETDRRIIFMREGESHLNYRIKLIDKDEVNMTIGDLLAKTESTTVRVEQGAPSLLLFSNMPEKTMHTLLGALRDNKVRFDLKAMVTKTNRSWTLACLLAELEEEHVLMQAWHELAQLTQKADLLLMEPAVLLDKGGFEAEVNAVKCFLKRESNEAITLDNLSDKKEKLLAHLTRLGY